MIFKVALTRWLALGRIGVLAFMVDVAFVREFAGTVSLDCSSAGSYPIHAAPAGMEDPGDGAALPAGTRKGLSRQGQSLFLIGLPSPRL